MKSRDLLAVFNRGLASRLALARVDVDRVALSAEVQTNWMPRVLGSMMLRPGMEYHGSVAGEGCKIPFVYDIEDTALLELSASTMRIWLSGDTLLSRSNVASTITNGAFASDLSGWTDADEGAAVSDWNDGDMRLVGTGQASAKRVQEVTVAGGDQGTAHGLRIVVQRGPVVLRIGTASGDDDIFRQAILRTGEHSISFTPNASGFFVQFSSPLQYPVLVESCEIESAGVVSIGTPWPDAATCRSVRWQRSRDVLFCAAEGYKQRRIERRPNNSWSVVEYESNDGPYEIENTSSQTLTPSAISGEITLSSSSDLFKAGHVGAIFRLTSQGQIVRQSASAENTFSDEIQVVGVDATRRFRITISGTWSGTISLQRSISAPGSWATVATYTTNQNSIVFDDGLDNNTIFYRIGFESGNYTSGTAELELVSDSGSITGVVRVTAVSSSTLATAIVLSNLGGTTATEIWSEGAWSDVLGWPSAVAMAEGRIVWSGLGRNWMSVSDAFDSFDPDFEGDAGPINRDIGTGATDRTNWIMPLLRLMVGTGDAEHSIRSTSFDEPITPANYNSRVVGTRGSAPVPGAIAGTRGYFVGRNANQLYELEYDSQRIEVVPERVSTLVPEIGDPGFMRIAAQHEPDTRILCVRSDGTMAPMVRDPAEDVIAWLNVETLGEIEDVSVLPGDVDDRVFLTVKRTINGSDVRYHEEIAPEADCRGGTINKQADAFVSGTQSSSATISGLSHLEGESVVLWADGKDLGTYTVSGGSVTASEAVTSYVVGLGYKAQFKSAKLGAALQDGYSITNRSRINSLGLVLADTHAQGLKFGQSFDALDDMPLVEAGADVDQDSVWAEYDLGPAEFPGDWSPDSRLCLQAQAPRPCTVMAANIHIDRQAAL